MSNDEAAAGPSPSQSVYEHLVDSEAAADPPGGRRLVARNGVRQIVAGALQSAGDQAVNAKTVLPWLLSAVGAPTGLTAVLVPLREAGSMLPQAALRPWVTGLRQRHRAWVAGALGQAVATLAMAAVAAWCRGALAGVLILLSLAVFAAARSLTSLAGKDVQGRTIPQGERGQVTGIATTVAGVVAISLGVGLRLTGDDGGTTAFAVILGAAALAWLVAGVVYAGVREPQGQPEAAGGGSAPGALTLVRADAELRAFVVARALLMVSALAPPLLVLASAQQGSGVLSGLAGFVVASGVAAVLGGRLFGGVADRSSRRLMLAAAIAATLTLAMTTSALALGWAPTWLLVVAFFLLSLVHTGARVGRKTYLVDVAEGDRRTTYIAASNTLMGLVLLGLGVLTAALVSIGLVPALGVLTVQGLLAVLATHRLPEVSGRG